MINANELRIGNLVKLNNTKARPKEVGNFAEVLAIDSEHSFNEYKGTVTIKPFGELNSYGQFVVFIEPIELTPEIFEKCGFRESKKQPVHFINLENPAKQLELLKSGEYFYPAIYQPAEVSSENDAMVYINRIQHLHQLQNLYFALTNSELNYTP